MTDVDFTENENQAELAALSRKILTERVTPQRLREAEAGGDRFDPALWADLAGAGILAAALPESLGGAGLGLLEQCSVLIELGRAVAPVPYLASIVLGAGAIARFGTAEQQRRWAAPAGRGELILTTALAEEEGDDPAAPSARAEPVKGDSEGGMGMPAGGGGWLLSGVKTTVPAAPLAALMLVPAAAPEGVTVFLVEPGDAGVTVERQQLTSGDSAGRVVLDGVRVGDDRVLGGRAVAGWLVAAGTVGLCALQAGVAGRALELTAEYARTRVQFGRPIGGFQAVAQRLADAYIDVEAIRLTMWQAAWRLSEGLPCGTEVATAKFWAADAGHRIAHTAVHVHGGVGIDLEYPLHRYFVAAKHNEFALGSATAQLRRIGAALARSG
ncbi:MAG TPA: acyl-CoA dehydrogenase family protein [Streptosporangiaceae bacterium]|nr:acyl-CoA dehydrogenase family protein [Streptosporangiaceae bacterium]